MISLIYIFSGPFGEGFIVKFLFNFRKHHANIFELLNKHLYRFNMCSEIAGSAG